VSEGWQATQPPALDWPPDPLRDAHFYESVTARRIVAYFLDLAIIVMLLLIIHLAIGMLTVLSLGLLGFLHLLAVPLAVALAYHIGLIASSGAATMGMRLFGLRAWSVLGGRPTPLQAVLHGFCFYGSMAATGGLIALVALFNPRRRTLHDMLAGVVVLREI
jgi:uncharacterized RDD family membrane protein YckC